MDVELLKKAELQTLLEGKSLHVVIIDDQRIIFAFHRNIGYIDGDQLILKDEFKPGRPAHTIILEEMIKVVKGIYKIDGVTTQENIDKDRSMIKELQDIFQLIKAETDVIKANAMAEKAEDLAAALATNKELFPDAKDLNDKIQGVLLKIASGKKEEETAPATKTVSTPDSPTAVDDANRHVFNEYLTDVSAVLVKIPDADVKDIGIRMDKIRTKVQILSGDELIAYYQLIQARILVDGVRVLTADTGLLLEEDKKPKQKAADPKSKKDRAAAKQAAPKKAVTRAAAPKKIVKKIAPKKAKKK